MFELHSSSAIGGNKSEPARFVAFYFEGRFPAMERVAIQKSSQSGKKESQNDKRPENLNAYLKT